MKKSLWMSIFVSCCCFLLLTALAAQYLLKEEQEAVSKQEASHKIMYLTFDDGPSQNTEKILDILKKYKVKATFFVTGEKPEYQELIKEEERQGHAVGIHSYSHNYAKIYASSEAYFDDIEKMNQIIKKQLGHETRILRFPGGSSNTVSRRYCDGIMSELSEQVVKQGYQYYDWNASNGDGNSHLSVDTLVSTGLKEVKDQEVVMMLMHDGAGSSETAEALPTLLESYLKQGYEFRIIDETTPEFHHHINN